MNVTERIRQIKDKLKEMAAAQTWAKRKRKGCPEERMSELWGQVDRRRDEITGHLNYYHHLRGSDVRHKPKELGRHYFIEQVEKNLEREFPATTKIC